MCHYFYHENENAKTQTSPVTLLHTYLVVELKVESLS